MSPHVVGMYKELKVVTLKRKSRMKCEASIGGRLLLCCMVTLVDILRVCGIKSGERGGVEGLVSCHRVAK